MFDCCSIALDFIQLKFSSRTFCEIFWNHENLEEANTIKARKEKGKEWERWRLWVPMAIYLLSACGVYVSSQMLENKTLTSQG